MSDDEHKELLYQVILGAPEGMQEDEIERVTGWLHQARIDAGLVEAFDRGDLAIRWPAGDSEPRFHLSEQGEIRQRQRGSGA
jgi:hypothetical protein